MWSASLNLYELLTLGRHGWWWKLHQGMHRHFRGLNPDAQVRELRGDDPGSLAYGETPAVSTLRMLQLSGLPKGSRLVDLGSGRGMVALVAAAVGYPSVGIEFFESFVERARLLAREMKVPAEFVCGDFLEAPLPEGDLYLVPATAYPESVRVPLEERLRRLPRGTRVITQDWLLGKKFQCLGSVRLPVTWGTALFTFYERG